jgi:hypothetical protein
MISWYQIRDGYHSWKDGKAPILTAEKRLLSSPRSTVIEVRRVVEAEDWVSLNVRFWVLSTHIDA